MQQQYSSNTQEITIKETLINNDIDYFQRNQQLSSLPTTDLQPQHNPNNHIPSEISDLNNLPQDKESLKLPAVQQNYRIQFTPKTKETPLSPFQIPTKNKLQLSPTLKKEKQVQPGIKFPKRQFKSSLCYLQLTPDSLKTLRKAYVDKKEKQLKLGSDFRTDFELKLHWKTINIPGATKISLVRQFILTNEWLESSDSSIGLWVCKMPKNSFEGFLKEQLAKGIPSLNNSSFVSIKQLNSWYTLAHIQSKFNHPFFLLEVKSQTSLFQQTSMKCPGCNNPSNSLCLCLQPNFCEKCSSANAARLHKIHCRYSSQLQLHCEKMELKPYARLGLIGLKNPDSMCFLNTALQCLLAVQPLTKYFLTRQYFRDLNPNNYLGSFGEITSRYAEFVNEAWCQSKAVYDPKLLRNSLGKFYNAYVESLNQQDSHECLSLILNYIREDLNSAPPPKPYQIDENEPQQLPDQDEFSRTRIKLYERHDSIIDDLFTIFIKSKIECSKCSFTSVTFEPALEVPLPILPPHRRQVDRKKINCCFIFQNTAQKNIQISIAVENERLEEVQNHIRVALGLKSHRKLVFYILSIHEGIQRLKWNSNLPQALSRLQAQKKQLFCLEYSQDQLSAHYFEITLVFQSQNRKSGTYENISFKRPLFFSKISRPKHARQLIKRILLYLFPRIYQNTTSITSEIYLHKYLEGPTPFKLFLATEFTNRSSIEISSGDQIKLSVNYTEVTVRFDAFSPFKIDELSITRRIDTTNHNFSIKGQRQMIVTQEATLNQCIKKFNQPQMIEGWKCSKCKTQTNRAMRTLSIYDTSKVIIFYLKRFLSDSKGKRGQVQHKKMNDLVRFPLVIDIKEFISKGKKEPTSAKKQEYRLKAVANHFESTTQSRSSGHYTAYVQNKHGWFNCNDETIEQINAGAVCTANAYYLIYEKIE